MAYFKVLLQLSPGQSKGKHIEYSDKLANRSNLCDVQLEYYQDVSIRALILCHWDEHVLQSSG
jgi:hypothetical protein